MTLPLAGEALRAKMAPESKFGAPKPTGPTNGGQSLIVTAAVEAGVQAGLLSGSERLAGVRVTEVGTGAGGGGVGVGSALWTQPLPCHRYQPRLAVLT